MDKTKNTHQNQERDGARIYIPPLSLSLPHITGSYSVVYGLREAETLTNR